MNKEYKNSIEPIDDAVNPVPQTRMQNVLGMFQTIVATGGVPAAPSLPPFNWQNQIQIYHNDAVWKLYVWDNTGNVWKSVTIS